MTIRNIRTMGDPVLRQQCEPITSFDAELRALVTDLIDTMTLVEGRAGVAAPQIGVPVRVFSYGVGGTIGYVVNPTIEVSADTQTDEEACLSLPGLHFETPRALTATVRGFDRHGEPIEITETGFLARALQHETQHLDGILFVDTLVGETRRQALREIRSTIARR
jgi:peptide deformylase